MKASKKTEIVHVTVTYWDCGNPNHRHKTRAVASACIQKREKREAKTPTMVWTRQAYAELLSQHRDGVRKCDLAKSLGLSRERVRAALVKAERLERSAASNDPMEKLSVRTRNCLRSKDLHTVEAIRAALAEGGLDNVPNMGKASKEEVRRWLDALQQNE